MNYLRSYSSNILTERTNVKQWERAVMIDLQSILEKAHVQIVDVPLYKAGDCKEFEMEYMARACLHYS